MSPLFHQHNLVNFQKYKLKIAFQVMGFGMLVAVLWCAFAGWVLGLDYPYNTFLFLPSVRFTDFSASLFFTKWPNPYDDPNSFYLPLAQPLLLGLSALPYSVSIIVFFFACLSGLSLFLIYALEPIVSNPWKRVFYALLLIGLSYPILFCVDRGNIEIIVFLLVAGALYFIGRGQYGMGMAWLVPAISFKLYPALMLVLFLRQRKIKWLVVSLCAVPLLTLASLVILSLSIEKCLELYHRNVSFFTQAFVCENRALEGSASLWNTYKIALIILSDLYFINPICFDYDSNFVRTSLEIYSISMSTLALILAVYVTFFEKDFLRCVAVLSLFLAMATPAGADYRLLYVCVALVSMILLKTRREWDVTILVIVALTLVPKREIILTFVGTTETGKSDVSIQTILNPLLIIMAIALLLWDGWRHSDSKWIKLRWCRMLEMVCPGRYGRKKADLLLGHGEAQR